MNELRSLEDKIQALQKKKTDLHTKSFMHMQKMMKEILKEDYDPELCMAIISETWKNASPTQKQEFIKKAENFTPKKKTYKRKIAA